MSVYGPKSTYNFDQRCSCGSYYVAALGEYHDCATERAVVAGKQFEDALIAVLGRIASALEASAASARSAPKASRGDPR